MTTKEDILEFLEIHQWRPVANSPYASVASKRRIQTDRMRLNKLPASKLASIAQYIKNGAVNRADANRQFRQEGFLSYRQLIPVMRRLFPDIF